MDLDRMKPADRLGLCRKYFFFGFACLPFLWLVNTIWFGHFVFIKKGETAKSRIRANGSAKSGSSAAEAPLTEQAGTSTGGGARRRTQPGQASSQTDAPVDPEVEEEKRRSLASIRKYVIFSAMGTLIWTAALVSWITIYQVNRASWGEFGDSISFNIPRGIP